jgi:MFS family permease
MVGFGIFCMGLSIASISPTTLSMVEQMVAISGRLTGILWACGSLGAIVLPWLVGYLLSNYGTSSMILALLINVSIGLIVFVCLLVYRSHIRKSKLDLPT